MVAIGGTAGRADEAPDLGVARGHQHVQEAGDVGGIGGDRVGQRAWHRAQRRLVKHIVHALAGAMAVGQFTDVALDEAEPRPRGFPHVGLDVGQVVVVAGGEVVQAHDLLAQAQQRLDQAAADEAGPRR